MLSYDKDNSNALVGLFPTIYGFGCMVAAAVSFSINKSIGWAILHTLCSWFYLVYAIATGQASFGFFGF